MAESKALGPLGHGAQAMDSYSCRRYSVWSTCTSGFQNGPAFLHTILVITGKSMPGDFQTCILGLSVISDWSCNSSTQYRILPVHGCLSDCVDATGKLDDIEDIVIFHFNVLTEPAALAQGTFAFAFAVSIKIGHKLEAFGTNL
jgi:hypothetical protein